MSNLFGFGHLMESLSISCDAEDRIEQDNGTRRDVHEVQVDLRQPLQSHGISNRGLQEDEGDLRQSLPSKNDSSGSNEVSSQQADNGVSEWVSSERAYQFSHQYDERYAASKSFDHRAEEIIEEARNAVPCSSGQVGYLDERTSKIIQEALKEKANPNAKLRSSDEVLHLARRVLSDNVVVPEEQAAPEEQSPKTTEKPKEREGEQPYLSPNISDSGASLEDYEKAVAHLPSKLSSSPNMNRQTMLNKIDGIEPPLQKVTENQPYHPMQIFDYIWGSNNSSETKKNGKKQLNTQHSMDESPTGELTDPNQEVVLTVSSKFSVGGGRPPLHSHAESIAAWETDPRMPSWITRHASKSETETTEDDLQKQGGCYSLDKSRTIIVHEILRGNWTWCTAWSPDGSRLAIATENHHLAVVETAGSTVWRVKHDRRINTPMKKDSTNSIRSIAWGSQFIAIGGTGNAVSILAPSEPYPIIHVIQETGFVGSLHWKPDSAVLAIGSRKDKCLIVNVAATDDDGSGPPGRGRRIDSSVLHSIERVDWVNVVCFSPGGSILAVGDRSGKLALYRYEEEFDAPSKISRIAKFMFEDSVLAVEWSPDGKWLYVGGEDFTVTVIVTSSWDIISRIRRDRWVQFIASSYRGSHIAVGGVASEVTILAADENWAPVMKVELKGLVPLSARWHPKDQFLALTGQDNSVLAIETTDARLVKGYFLQSISAILAVEFSPDGLNAAVGNKDGLVSFYKLSEPTFVTSYEMVLAESGSQSIEWSADGKFVIVGSARSLVVIGKPEVENTGGAPPNTSGFSVRKVIRSTEDIHSVSIDGESRFVAVGGGTTRILDAASDFKCVREWKNGVVLANAWSPDGTWLAMIGRSQNLTIYDTSNELVGQWRIIFTLQVEEVGLALAWAPMDLDGLQYLAYGGEDQKVTVIEVRTHEETWETVLEIPRAGVVHDLGWNSDGILAVAVGDGTVSILDLGYLRSGWAVNEMDYNWQRQGIVCSVELRRNLGNNSMRTVRWMPSSVSGNNYLAVGGTDGALEVVDLTERERCRGFGVSEDLASE